MNTLAHVILVGKKPYSKFLPRKAENYTPRGRCPCQHWPALSSEPTRPAWLRLLLPTAPLCLTLSTFRKLPEDLDMAFQDLPCLWGSVKNSPSSGNASPPLHRDTVLQVCSRLQGAFTVYHFYLSPVSILQI